MEDFLEGISTSDIKLKYVLSLNKILQFVNPYRFVFIVFK